MSDGDGLPALAPAVRLAIKTTHGAKVLVFPNLGESNLRALPAIFVKLRDPAGYITNGGAATFTAHVGDATWTLLCRDEPQKDWRGIEGVFEPGNETVTVNKDNNDRVGVHSLTRDGKWIEEIADTGDPGLQRPGDRWVRVGQELSLRPARAATSSRQIRQRHRRSALTLAAARRARARPP